MTQFYLGTHLCVTKVRATKECDNFGLFNDLSKNYATKTVSFSLDKCLTDFAKAFENSGDSSHVAMFTAITFCDCRCE